MAYNNGFPATYSPMYYTPQYTPPMQMMPQQPAPQTMPQQNNTGILWVQGEAGAKSHLVAPNTTVALWDSEAQRIFLKSADAAGMPSMKILNYTIEETPNISAPVQKAVNASVAASGAAGGFMSEAEREAFKEQVTGLRSELDTIRAEMDTFRNDLYGIAGKKSTPTRKKEAAIDE